MKNVDTDTDTGAENSVPLHMTLESRPLTALTVQTPYPDLDFPMKVVTAEVRHTHSGDTILEASSNSASLTYLSGGGMWASRGPTRPWRVAFKS